MNVFMGGAQLSDSLNSHDEHIERPMLDEVLWRSCHVLLGRVENVHEALPTDYKADFCLQSRHFERQQSFVSKRDRRARQYLLTLVKVRLVKQNWAFESS